MISCQGPMSKRSHPSTRVVTAVWAAAMLLTACNFPGIGTPPTVFPSPTSPSVNRTPAQGQPGTTASPTTAAPTNTPTPAGISQSTVTPPSSEVDLIEPLSPGRVVTISTISMLDQNRGWAIGSLSGSEEHVLRTTDGGATWQDVSPPQPILDLEGFDMVAVAEFMDANTGWVAYLGSPITWRTQDGGTSWQPSSAIDMPEYLPYTAIPNPLYFLTPPLGWRMVYLESGMSHDYVALYATQDRGQTWTKLLDPTTSADLHMAGKTGMAFSNPGIGVVTTDQGPYVQVYLVWTHDGGLTWEFQEPPSPAEHPDLFTTAFCRSHSPRFFSTGELRIGISCRSFDDTNSEMDFLYSTVDEGLNWESLPYPGGDLFFLTEGQGFAFSREIHFTNDGGATWQLVKTVNWDGQFSFIDDQFGWAVARADGAIALVRTNDGGSTWGEIQPRIGP